MPTPKKKANTRAGKKGPRAVKAWACLSTEDEMNIYALSPHSWQAKHWKNLGWTVIPVRIVPLRERGAR